VTLEAQRFHIQLVEFTLEREFSVTSGATEVVDAEALVQRRDDVAGDGPIAYEANVPEELVEMGLAVG